MDKRILIIYYSQSGQLKQIAENFCKPFVAAGAEVDWYKVIPENDFPFPWDETKFFDAMPESVLGMPMPLKSNFVQHTTYDLVVFAYQPWFLSPSIPATSALKSEAVKKLLIKTPVVTLVGARNMWINAQQKVKQLLFEAKANHVGNIVLTDKNPNLISAITIQHWLYSGKKDRMWGVFPLPGVADRDIQSAHVYGEIVKTHLVNNKLGTLQAALIQAKAVQVRHILMFIEGRAGMLFSIWANAILKKKNRSLWLKIFKYYLMFALFLLSPIVILIYVLILAPLSLSSIKKKKAYNEGVNL